MNDIECSMNKYTGKLSYYMTFHNYYCTCHPTKQRFGIPCPGLSGAHRPHEACDLCGWHHEALLMCTCKLVTACTMGVVRTADPVDATSRGPMCVCGPPAVRRCKDKDTASARETANTDCGSD